MLVPVGSAEQLLASVKTGFSAELTRNVQRLGSNDEGQFGAPESSVAGDGRISTTYTQEASVDEHDTVKYDGRHLYIAPSRSMRCCFIFEPALDDVATDALIAPFPPPDNRAIRILATDPDTAAVSEAGSIELADNRTVEGMYIDNERLAAITSTAWWGYYGPEYERADLWAEQSAGFQIYDVSSPSEPQINWEIEIEGGFVDSRLVGTTVYLISRHTPSIQGLQYYPLSEEESDKNAPLIDALTVEDIIPRVLINGEEGSLFAPEDCFVLDPDNELAPKERGFPVLTSIIAIDLQNPGIADVTCYNESASGTYVSANAIYLTQHDFNDGLTPQTIIHRFAYQAGLDYTGSGKVEGDLRTGGNLDFRISESGDFLRLVTTT